MPRWRAGVLTLLPQLTLLNGGLAALADACDAAVATNVAGPSLDAAERRAAAGTGEPWLQPLAGEGAGGGGEAPEKGLRATIAAALA